ncbi:hypothetical protein [Coleofasciculus sp. FACHB-1120]|nr:hypothetical protein [Coleofasciculus sp. FACHB-1120]
MLFKKLEDQKFSQLMGLGLIAIALGIIPLTACISPLKSIQQSSQ